MKGKNIEITNKMTTIATEKKWFFQKFNALKTLLVMISDNVFMCITIYAFEWNFKVVFGIDSWHRIGFARPIVQWNWKQLLSA